MAIGLQITYLFIIAIPIACIAWTVTHEEIFKEPREFCLRKSKQHPSILGRKFFYLFTCEYCFSHYVTALLLVITQFRLIYDDWRGYLIAGFALVWIANMYMGLFALLRQNIKVERLESELKQEALKGEQLSK
jgi:hypothetical protein